MCLCCVYVWFFLFLLFLSLSHTHQIDDEYGIAFGLYRRKKIRLKCIIINTQHGLQTKATFGQRVSMR